MNEIEDPKIPFADTTARRAQLMAATERFKTSISDGVESVKQDATEIGKTVVFVGGVALAVYLVVNAILPKSNDDRERYASLDERDDEDELESSYKHAAERRAALAQATNTRTSAVAGMVSGILTTVLTNIAREQLTGFLARIRTNNAINPTAEPTQYHEQAPTEPVDYTS